MSKQIISILWMTALGAAPGFGDTLQYVNICHLESEAEEINHSNEQAGLWHLSCGNDCLLLKEYLKALQHYKQAERSLNGSSEDALEFLIEFGKAAAFDGLHWDKEREDSLDKLFVLTGMSNQEICNFSEEDAEPENFFLYFRALADAADSQQTKSRLLSLAANIASLDGRAIRLDSQDVGYCGRKSFWRRVEKLAHNVRRTCIKILDLVERCINIADRFQGHRSFCGQVGIEETLSLQVQE